MISAASLLIHTLESLGVTHIFMLPGEETLGLMEALRQSAIQTILTRDEQEAGFMAATWGRLSGRPGVCLVTLGPGLTNILTPVTHAQLAGFPMILISGQKGYREATQGRFQQISAQHILQSLTKQSTTLLDPKQLPYQTAEAYRLARAPRPGVVHLELPEDIAAEQIEEDSFPFKSLGGGAVHFSMISTEVAAQHAAEHLIRAAVKLLNDARHPIAIVGGRGQNQKVFKALKKFLEKTQMPICSTQMGKGAVDERSENYLGTLITTYGEALHQLTDQADLILSIGYDIAEKPPCLMNRPNLKVIHLNTSDASYDPYYMPDLRLVGDMAANLERIREQVTAPNDNGATDWSIKQLKNRLVRYEKNRAKEIKARAAQQDPQPNHKNILHRVARKNDQHRAVGLRHHPLKSASMQQKKIPITEIVALIRAALPENAILSLDNGLYKLSFSAHFRVYAPHTILLDNCLATMGAGLPNALAAKLYHKDQPVVAVCGDGGFMMNGQALATAQKLGLDLLILVLADHAYGMIAWKQNKQKLKPFGVEFNNPDFVQYAEAYGASGYRVDSALALQTKIQQLIPQKGVHLIEVPLDYAAT